MSCPVSDYSATLARLRAASDLTDAVCLVDDLRRDFAAAHSNVSLRTGCLEAALSELEGSQPILLAFDEPIQQGRPILKAWIRRLWLALAALFAAAFAAGFLAGRAV